MKGDGLVLDSNSICVLDQKVMKCSCVVLDVSVSWVSLQQLLFLLHALVNNLLGGFIMSGLLGVIICECHHADYSTQVVVKLNVNQVWFGKQHG